MPGLKTAIEPHAQVGLMSVTFVFKNPTWLLAGVGLGVLFSSRPGLSPVSVRAAMYVMRGEQRSLSTATNSVPEYVNWRIMKDVRKHEGATAK